MNNIFVVRSALPADVRFIAASWFESFWKATMQPAGTTWTVYHRAQDALINTLIDRSSVVVVASAPVPDEIIGYAVVERDVAHYVYVKAAYRRAGIAKGLLRNRVTRYTHTTRAGNRVARSLGITFDPYALLEAPCPSSPCRPSHSSTP